MSVDQDYLGKNGVSAKIIDLLFHEFKGSIPALPLTLKLHDEDKPYFAPNAFYALKILIKQGSTPSAKGVLKLIGGKTQRVHQEVGKLKEMLPGEFHPEPIDPAVDALGSLKRELIKTETARFKVELEDQERDTEKKLTALTNEYEVKIQALERKLAVKSEMHKQLLDLSKDHTNTIESLQAKVNHKAIKQAHFDSALLIAEERLETIVALRSDANKAFEAYKVEREASSKANLDIRDERDAADNRTTIANQELAELKEVVKKYLEERESQYKEISELNNQLQQQELTLSHQHNQDQFIETLKDSLSPLKRLSKMIEMVAEIKKEKAVDLSSVVTSITDLSTHILNMKSKSKPVKKGDSK